MALQESEKNSSIETQDEVLARYPYTNIIRPIRAISLLSSVLFLLLSYFSREIGYYLLAGASLITLVFSITALPKAPKKPSAFIVFMLAASYQLLIILLASILPAYLGIPYALVSVMLAFIFTSVIPHSALSDWIVTLGILGGIASLELSILGLLPQINNQAIATSY
jgi:hypothetical protein